MLLYASTIEHEQHFLDANGFKGKDPVREGIAAVYFAFTSLSTVGFGDYHPFSNNERLLCAFILISGVLVFSYLMDYFLGVINGL